MSYDLESFIKGLFLCEIGVAIVIAFTILIHFQPTTEISTQVISDPGISYSNNSYYIKNKTKLDKVAARKFFKKSTNNNNLKNKIRLTTTKGTFIPTSDLTATQYIYHK